MSLYKHHQFRLANGLTSKAEIALAILEKEGECKQAHLRYMGLGYHSIVDILNHLVKLNFIQVRSIDNRMKLYSLTSEGHEYIKIVKSFYRY